VNIAGTSVARSEKKTWNLVVGETVTGPLTVPVTVVRGAKEGPILAVLAACHPGELNGVMTSIRLAKAIQPKDLTGTLIIVHAQNVLGVQFRKGHISPLDGVNMGQAFPRHDELESDNSALVSHQGKSPTYQAAGTIFREIINRSNGLIDLHGGEFFESLPTNIEILMTGDRELDGRTRAFSRMFGVNLIWEVAKGSIPEIPHYPGRGSAVGEAGLRGIPGAFFEVGGEGKLEEPLVELTMRGIKNVMAHMGMLKIELVTVKPTVLVGGHVLFAKRAGLLLTKVVAGQRVSKGDSLGEIVDLTGEIVETVIAPDTGVLTNVCTLGSANPGDMLYVLGNLTNSEDHEPYRPN